MCVCGVVGWGGWGVRRRARVRACMCAAATGGASREHAGAHGLCTVSISH